MPRPQVSTLAVSAGLFVLAACSDGAPTEPLADTEHPSPAAAAAASNTWTALAALPSARLSLAAAVVEPSAGRPVLYAIGGDDGNGVTIATVDAYDFTSRTWSSKAPLPTPLESAAGAAVIDGRIYLAGGRNLDNHSPGSDDGFPRKSLYVYDPAADRWSRKADLPLPTMLGVAGAIDGKLYVMNPDFSAFFRYDPVSDTWSPLPKCPGPHFAGAGAVIRGKLYVAGGERFTANGPIAVRRLHVYDPATNTWSERARMPHAVAFSAAARLLGQLYVLGGYANNLGRSYVQAYDPATDTWTAKKDLPTFRVALAAANVVLDGQQRIVAVGGSGGEGDRYLKSNDLYMP
jgi:N-acetylneuraminic acid mutarotase